MGPDIFDGPSHNELLFERDDKLSKLIPLRNMGCGGIGPFTIVDKPSHILFFFEN